MKIYVALVTHYGFALSLNQTKRVRLTFNWQTSSSVNRVLCNSPVTQIIKNGSEFLAVSSRMKTTLMSPLYQL